MNISYLLRIGVFIQPIFWVLFYYSGIQLKHSMKEGIMMASMFAVYLVYQYQFAFDFYTSFLLIQYIVMVNYTFMIFENKYSTKDALCIAFLLVYMNSYYWEAVLHFAEYSQVGFRVVMIREVWRLTPVLFFIQEFQFDKKAALRLLRKGILLSFIVALIYVNFFLARNIHRLSFIPFDVMILKVWMYFVNKFICLNILIKILYDSKRKEAN